MTPAARQRPGVWSNLRKQADVQRVTRDLVCEQCGCSFTYTRTQTGRWPSTCSEECKRTRLSCQRRREPRSVTVPCSHCGSDFIAAQRSRGRLRTTCSDSCRSAQRRARAQLATMTRSACVIDGCEQVRRSAHEQHCEAHYMRMRRRGSTAPILRAPNGKCWHCGAQAPRQRLFCSDRCRRRNRLGAAGPFDSCAACGHEIERPFATVYCSEKCLSTAARAKLYRLTPAALHRLLVAASGCAICGRNDRSLVVDHDHTSGVVRALLCSGCNTGIGALRESPEVLRAAATYLELHSTR